MQKTLFISDLHLDDDPRNIYRWKIFPWVIENIFDVTTSKVKGSVPTSIIIAGDLTNEKDNHSSQLVNSAVTGICSWLKYVEQIYILMGNHDGIDYNCPFFKFLGAIPGIKYINSPTEIPNGSPHHFLFLPHTKDPVLDWSGIDFSGKIAVGHVTVDGAFAESGQMLPSSVESKIFDNAAVAYSGDIHKPQVVGNLRYIGCPYNVRYGDNFEGRVLTLDLDSLDEQVFNTGFLRRLSLTTSSAEDLAVRIDLLKQAENIKEAQVKVKLLLDYSNMGQMHSIVKDVKDIVKKAGFELRGLEIKKNTVGAYVPQTAIQKKFVDFDQFCASQNIPDEIKNVGASIIAEEVAKRLLVSSQPTP